MTDYYYLAGGEEHGPFSRMALARLIDTGRLDDALFRTSPSDPWRTAKELGLSGVEARVAPPIEQQSLDVAQKRSSKTLLVTLSGVLLGLTALWLYELSDARPKGAENDVSSVSRQDPTRPSTGPVQKEGEPILSGKFTYGTNPDEGVYFTFQPASPNGPLLKYSLRDFGSLAVAHGLPDFQATGFDGDCSIMGSATLKLRPVEGRTTDKAATLVDIQNINFPKAALEKCTYSDEAEHSVSSVEDVLSIARKKPFGRLDATRLSSEECLCKFNGNSVEIDASTSIWLYKDAATYVVVVSEEDNHGNPRSHFYQLKDGSWQDVGRLVVPDYTSDPGVFLQATPEGISRLSEGQPPEMYVFRNGQFAKASSG